MFAATVLTLFPEMFPGPLGLSRAGRARAEAKWSLDAVNIRDHGLGRHRQVDDTPFGGGAGMVMRPDVLDAAIEAAQPAGRPLLCLTPRGEPLRQAASLEALVRAATGTEVPVAVLFDWLAGQPTPAPGCP
jgi:tRNA (guanine37-N1)-methyltransferase